MDLRRSRVLRPIVVAVVVLVGLLVAAVPAEADYIHNSYRCNTGRATFYGASHACLTGTAISYVEQTAGQPTAERYFAVGADHHIWNVVKYSNGYFSGWKSLGGWGKSGVWTSSSNGARYATIYTIGQDSKKWCKRLSAGSWGPWYRC
jgi:hypothetical protein